MQQLLKLNEIMNQNGSQNSSEMHLFIYIYINLFPEWKPYMAKIVCKR